MSRPARRGVLMAEPGAADVAALNVSERTLFRELSAARDCEEVSVPLLLRRRSDGG
jgi:hypothetical protein